MKHRKQLVVTQQMVESRTNDDLKQLYFVHKRLIEVLEREEDWEEMKLAQANYLLVAREMAERKI